MSENDISQIGNLSVSFFNQLANQYQEQIDINQEVPNKEYQRLRWLQLIVQKEKVLGMEKVIDYLKIKNLIQKQRLIQLHLYFNRFYRMTIRRKWLRLKQKIILKNCNEKFTDKNKRVCEIRSRQAMNYISEEINFSKPDLSFLVQQNYQLDSLHSLRGKGKITTPEPIPRYRRKDAIILYLWVIVISILIGLLLYKCNHCKLYKFIDLQKSMKNPKVNQTQKFTYPKSPEQTDVINEVLNIV